MVVPRQSKSVRHETLFLGTRRLHHLIFDRQRSAVQPIAWCEEDDIADLICAALNGGP